MDQQIIQEILQQLRSIAQGINNPWAVLIPLLAVVVALILGIIGIFQDWIRSWFRKPDLEVSLKLEPPDCHKIAMRDPKTGQHICDTYYFRFRVKNTGNYQMASVEAMVTDLYKKSNDKYEKVRVFLPLNLVWSHYRNITMSKI
jgi:hypothetical protein